MGSSTGANHFQAGSNRAMCLVKSNSVPRREEGRIGYLPTALTDCKDSYPWMTRNIAPQKFADKKWRQMEKLSGIGNGRLKERAVWSKNGPQFLSLKNSLSRCLCRTEHSEGFPLNTLLLEI